MQELSSKTELKVCTLVLDLKMILSQIAQ